MKSKTKSILHEAWAWCDWKDKSTEFMIQYMADKANMTQDAVVDFIGDSSDDQRQQWYIDNPNWTEKYN